MTKKNENNEVEEIKNEEEILDDDLDEEIKVEDDEEENGEHELTDVSIEDRVIEIEKKINVILIVGIITAILSLLAVIFTVTSKDDDNSTNNYASTNNNSNSNSNSQSSTNSYDTSAFKEISASDIKSESNNDTIVLWIGRQGCGYCAAFTPTIIQAGKDFGIQIRYIDFGKIVDFTAAKPYVKDTAAWSTLESLTGTGSWKDFVKNELGGTPLTIIIKKNKVVGGVVGNYDLATVEKAFTDAGLKKK